MTKFNSDKIKKKAEMYLSGHKKARKTGRSVSDSGATLMALDLR